MLSAVPPRYRLDPYQVFADAMRPVEGGSVASPEAPGDGTRGWATTQWLYEKSRRLVLAQGDDHPSLVAFAEEIAANRGFAPVATHPWGPCRFEGSRADAIDRELGVALRLIEPALFRPDAPATDRPWLPRVWVHRPPVRPEAILIGYRRREGHAAEAALCERVVQEVVAGRDGVVWQPDPSRFHHIFVDHLDPDFGGYTADGLGALGRAAACLGAAVQVGPHVEAFWQRPPVVLVRDGEALARELAALLDDRDRLHALRVASWEWARAVASEEPFQRRLDAWIDEAILRADERTAVAKAGWATPDDGPPA